MHAITAPPTVESADRLGFTLFIAIAAHAIVVLGVTFAPHERARELISTLEIVLVQRKSEDQPDGVGVELGERDRWIAAQIGPAVRDKGLLFVGLDVIGDHVTEINVTSPTCIRELDAIYGLDIGAQLMDAIETLLEK